MRANHQKPYLPREGKMISDLNRAWERLEKAEHEREGNITSPNIENYKERVIYRVFFYFFPICEVPYLPLKLSVSNKLSAFQHLR